LKLLFWQDGYELLNHSIDHVSMMTCNSLPIDQIEYHVVVSQFILKSFQDTLVSKHKLTILTRNNAQMIVKLTTHIFNSIYRLSILGLSHKVLMCSHLNCNVLCYSFYMSWFPFLLVCYLSCLVPANRLLIMNHVILLLYHGGPTSVLYSHTLRSTWTY
jgi:hypothetical protein